MMFSFIGTQSFSRAIRRCSSSFLGLVLFASGAVASEKQPDIPGEDGLGVWEIAAVVFVVGMLLSVFHSISLLKHSSKPGPEYWLNRMAHACSKGDPKAAEQALLLWASAIWGTDAPGTLLEIANRLERDEMAQLIRQMREASRDASAEWNGYLCVQVLVDYLRQIADQHKGGA